MGAIQFMNKRVNNNSAISDLIDVFVTINKVTQGTKKSERVLVFSFSPNAIYKAFRNNEYIRLGKDPDFPRRIYIAPAPKTLGYKLSGSENRHNGNRKVIKPYGKNDFYHGSIEDWVGEYPLRYDKDHKCWYIERKATYGNT